MVTEYSIPDYVVGFLFTPNLEHVILIRKNRPAWQKGYLNGPGGKVLEGEHIHDAMKREFKEEAGLYVPVWKPYCCLTKTMTYRVNFFCATSVDFCQAKTTTDEEVVAIPVGHINRSPNDFMVRNGLTMVLMAQYVLSGQGEDESITGEW